MDRRSNFSPLNNGKRVALLFVMLLTLLFTSGCDEEYVDGKDTKTNGNQVSVGTEDDELLTIDKVVEKTGPSVVNIATNNGRGSGVIFREDGYIVTNDHVIRGASAIEVHLSDKRTLKAKLVGTDSRRDIAVIKVEEKNLRPAKFADSSKEVIGGEVVAIGNARGVENSVTRGIISNVNIDVDTGTNISRCIQTDAAINPGNSGGALLNMYGNVIGINDMMRPDSENIGFAIPSNDAKEIATQIIEKGYVSIPYLGVDAVNQKTNEGNVFIWVRNIMPDSPAAKAGLKKNDIIVNINDARVETVSQMREQLNSSGIGSMVSIYILRNTKQGVQEGTIQLKLEELPKGYYTIDWS